MDDCEDSFSCAFKKEFFPVFIVECDKQLKTETVSKGKGVRMNESTVSEDRHHEQHAGHHATTVAEQHADESDIDNAQTASEQQHHPHEKNSIAKEEA